MDRGGVRDGELREGLNLGNIPPRPPSPVSPDQIRDAVNYAVSYNE